MLRRRLIAFLPVLPLAAVAVWVFGFSSLMIRADVASMSARYKLDNWMAGKQQWTVPEWLEAREGLESALKITPENPALQDYLGTLYAFRGYEARRVPVLRKAFYTDALPYQRKSLALRPHNAAAWANYAQSLYMLDVRGATLERAERTALALGQYESGVRRTVQDVMLATWQTQPGDLQAWMQASVCEMNADGLARLHQQTELLGINNLSAKACSTATARTKPITIPLGAL
jgi:tetratricopeptide (TPR) repeat protein